MKKHVIILAIVLSIFVVLLCLASYGDLSGTYQYGDEESGIELAFSGNNVTMKVFYDGEEYSIEGEYELNDDEDEIAFSFDEDDIEAIEDDDAPDNVIYTIEVFDGREMDFKEGDDYIKLDKTRFTKK